MSGSSASARASAARLTMPPDRSDGYLSPALAGKPAKAIFSRARRAASPAPRPACSMSGKATFSITVSEENKAPFWNNTPKRRSTRLRCAAGRLSRSSPNTFTVPSAGRFRPTMVRSNTDLPVPEPPTTLRISPRRTSRSSASCTTWLPNWLRTARTSMMFSACASTFSALSSPRVTSPPVTSPSPYRTAPPPHRPR